MGGEEDGLQPIPWRAGVAQAVGVWLASRVCLVLITYFSVLDHPITGPRPPASLITSWIQWDANWYLKIARIGYFSDQSTAFFPLYPLLVRVVSLPFGPGAGAPVAMAISNLAVLAAFVGVGLLAMSESGQAEDAGRSLRVMAAYPLAFFLVTAYSEALFAALAAFTLLFARRGVWYGAAAMAFLATLTRPVGILLILPLVIEYVRQHGWRRVLEIRMPHLLQPAMILSAAPLALGIWAGFQWSAFRHPFLFLQVQSLYWHRQPLPIWVTFRRVGSQLIHLPLMGTAEALVMLDLGLLLGVAALTLVTIKRQPLAFTVFTLALIAASVSSPLVWGGVSLLTSTGRYLAVALPVFLTLGRALKGRPGVETLVVGGGFMLQGLLLSAFLQGTWLE